MTKDNIIEIIDKFANNDVIFSNEQDFQIELANELLKLDEVEKIKIEPLSFSQTWEKIECIAKNKEKLPRDKKQYTDILVKDKKSGYIAIELKYATPYKICLYETKNGKIVTMAQGAYDIRSYEFIKDINRLENINNRNFFPSIKINKSYAIMLTNDFNYRYNTFNKSKIWQKYSLAVGKLKKGKLTFKENETEYKTKNHTYEAITLKNDYELQWYDYKLENYQDYQNRENSYCPGFSYLIVEIDNN